MGSEAEEVQSAATIAIKAAAETIRRERLETAGLAEQFDLWRESMPNTEMPDNDVYNLFMEGQEKEESASLGTLSVATGGEEDILRTEVPTPGPDEDGGGPGEAGEPSKGGDDDPTDLKLVEGMWAPPPEADAVNYEPPSTYQMTQSADFIKEARILYDYMNPPRSLQDRQMEAWQAKTLYQEFRPLNDYEIGKWARNIMSGFNWNVVNTVAMAKRIMTADDPELALAFLNMMNMYDHSSGSKMDFAGALGEIATDPTTYIGLGAGSIVAKGAAKALAKTGLKKAIQGALVGATAGAIEGGTLAGGFDLTKQKIEQEVGAREEIDYGRVGIATSMGVGLGTILGAAGGAWAGRKIDKFVKAMDEDKAMMKARDVFLDERAMEEIGIEELGEILGHFTGPEGKAQAKAILAETGTVPRLEDGSVDYKKIYRIMDEVSAAHAIAKEPRLDTVESVEQLGVYMEQISFKDNRWVLESNGNVTFFQQDGNYKRLESLADALGIDYSISGKEGLRIFTIAGGSPNSKADFVHKATGMRPGKPVIRRATPFRGSIVTSRQAGKQAGNEVRFIDDIEDPRYQAEVESLANELDIEIHDITGDKGVIGGEEGFQTVIDVINAEEQAMHLNYVGNELEVVGTFQHYGPLQDVAEGLGLKVKAESRVDGFSLKIEGTPDELILFLSRIYDGKLDVPELSNIIHPKKPWTPKDELLDIDEIVYQFANVKEARMFKEAWDKQAGNEVRFVDDIEDPTYQADVESLANELDIEIHDILGEEGEIIYKFASDEEARIFQDAWNERDIFLPDVTDAETMALVRKVMEVEELQKGDVVLKRPGQKGSTVIDDLNVQYEVIGRTKNGWYRLRNKLTGDELSMRRKQFEVIDKAPIPEKAGPMELNPFSDTAARMMVMNEQVLSGELKLRPVKMTHAEQKAQVEEMEKLGIDITQKPIASYWTPADLRFLRDTYNKQGRGMAEISKFLANKIDHEGRLSDSDMAYFNNAHAVFVATRDLFYGVSGNAARQLNTLRSKPTEGVYDFGQAMMDSIAMQGGRANTERAIKIMAEFASPKVTRGDLNAGIVPMISKLSKNIWGNKYASALLHIRYNQMLSSWRTHAFNLMGNTISGLYMHLAVSPVRMGINNLAYARDLALSVINPKYKPDPADRMTRHQYYAELQGHRAAFMDSLFLAKEIAMGRDIGEGKIWNELGLRYNIINVPKTALGKIGTTPVRVLEAGDAFFKNQYYISKMHEIASIRARYDEVHLQKDYKKRYAHYLENFDELGAAAEREAKAYAAKQTYTNDPSVYGGLFTVIADGVASMQNQSLTVNMIIPFVRTPANLLQYSMETIGVQQFMTPNKTYQAIINGTQRESQEAIAKLTIAAGLWLTVQHLHEEGLITGTGPGNWEERQVWIAAGWQPNSVKIHGKWVSIERAAPGGQSLATIASVFDYYAMTQQQNKPFGEWIGAGLLYTADMILDESYLSSATDVLTAISSKEQGRFQATAASMINSVLVPNLLRDFRKPADVTQRTTAAPNLMLQVVKQMKNASPWHSSELAPRRDWRGEPKDSYGSAFWRAIVPFNIRDPEDSDPASMAIAYARIPISKPNASIDWPGGLKDGIDLWWMDNGQGYVYDEYERRVGEMRNRAVKALMELRIWDEWVEEGNIGPGSEGDRALREVISMGSQFGRLDMLDFLIEHSEDNSEYYRIGPEGVKQPYIIQHAVSVDEYIDLQCAIREEGYEITDEERQYIIKKPVKGPQFFKPAGAP